MVEQAFPLTGFVGLSTKATFGGSGVIMSTARLQSPFPCISRPSLWLPLLGDKLFCDKPPLVVEHVFPPMGVVGSCYTCMSGIYVIY